MRDVTTFGSFVFFVILLFFVAALEEYNLLKILFIGFVLTSVIPVLVRVFYYKDRPKKQVYRNFVEKMDASSFPSIHAARVTFIGLALHDFLGSQRMTFFLIGFVGLVLYSRYSLKKHDVIDLIGGVVTGILCFWISGLI